MRWVVVVVKSIRSWDWGNVELSGGGYSWEESFYSAE